MSDLTKQEQANVKLAIAFLRVRVGGMRVLTKALHFSMKTLQMPATAAVAFRVARMAGVGIDDVLAGRFPPPGTCAHCGYSEAAP